MDKQELLNKRLNLIIGPLYVKVTMYLMVVSFFIICLLQIIV